MHTRLIAQTIADTSFERGINGGIGNSVHSAVSLDIAGGGVEQKQLFWGESPNSMIIIMIQFMQFGFAVTLSIVLIFWKDINADSGLVAGEYFFHIEDDEYEIMVNKEERWKWRGK